MTYINKNYFRKIFKLLLSISLIVTGICLISGCVYIFYSGSGYSRQIVTDVFSVISIPIYLCLFFIAIDIVWELISPTDKENKTFKKKKNNTPQVSPADKKTKIIQISILCVAVALLIFGFIMGGYADVLTKAVNICTECIGLG